MGERERRREGELRREWYKTGMKIIQLPPTLTAAGSCPAEEAEIAPAKHQPSMEEEVGQC